LAEINNENLVSTMESSIIPNIDEDEKTIDISSSEVEVKDAETNEEEKKKELSFDTTDEDVKDAIKEEIETEEKEKKKEENRLIKKFDNIEVKAPSNFMSNVVVDLNNITIIDKPVLSQNEDLTFMINSNNHTFPVVCCQSGYAAQMTGLTLAEKNAINNSNLSIFQSRQILYKTVYNKISSMGFEKPSFDDWLKITSWGDLNTLLFGIYCETYTENNDFDITCGKCKKKTSVTIDNQSMIEVKDKEIYGKIDELVHSIKSGEELANASIIHQKHRVMLNNSKIIFDIKNPTLWDHLLLLKQSKQEIIKQYPEAFSAILFISNMYMPDTRSFMKGKPSWYEVTNRAQILHTLLEISTKDGDQLEAYIEKELGKFKITYEISNITCSHCKAKLPNIPVDMETVLFTRINKQMNEQES